MNDRERACFRLALSSEDNTDTPTPYLIVGMDISSSEQSRRAAPRNVRRRSV